MRNSRSNNDCTIKAKKYTANNPTISVLSITSERDTIIEKGTERGILAPTATMTERYLEQNRITGEPSVSRLPDKDKQDGVLMRVERYGPGESGALLELWVAEGADHAVHGYPREGESPRRRTGVCQDFYFPEVAWEFLKKCPPRKLASKEIAD